MDLKEFIKTALSDITGAVSDAQQTISNGAIINPTFDCEKHGLHLLVNGEARPIERLNFDIAVTTSETLNSGGNMRAGISVLGVKAEGGSTSENGIVSRLAFSIPLLLPASNVKSKK